MKLVRQLLIVLVMAGLTSTAFAVDFVGDIDNTWLAGTDGVDTNWEDDVFPGPLDTATIETVGVTLSGAAGSINRLLVGDSAAASLTILPGGDLTTGWVRNGKQFGAEGLINVSGGTLTVSGGSPRIEIAGNVPGGIGTLKVENGGVVNVTSDIWLGPEDGDTATLHVSGSGNTITADDVDFSRATDGAGHDGAIEPIVAKAIFDLDSGGTSTVFTDLVDFHNNPPGVSALLELNVLEPPPTSEIVLFATDRDTRNGTFNGLPEGAMVTDTSGIYSWTLSYVGGDGNDISLSSLTIIPEPATSVMIVFGLGGLGVFYRKR